MHLGCTTATRNPPRHQQRCHSDVFSIPFRWVPGRRTKSYWNVAGRRLWRRPCLRLIDDGKELDRTELAPSSCGTPTLGPMSLALGTDPNVRTWHASNEGCATEVAVQTVALEPRVIALLVTKQEASEYRHRAIGCSSPRAANSRFLGRSGKPLPGGARRWRHPAICIKSVQDMLKAEAEFDAAAANWELWRPVKYLSAERRPPNPVKP